MASVRDVAQYIRDRMGDGLSTIKLQKLVYYAKAWSLVWDEDPLFPEPVQAWAIGPVSPDLYALHKGQFFSPETFAGADTTRLTDEQKENIDIVMRDYGDKSPQYLVALSRSEDPWKELGIDCRIGEQSTAEISDASIAEYYSGLL